MDSSTEIEPILISLDEAARRLSISRRTIEREIAFGRFPRPLKVGRSTRVAIVDLDAYVQRLREPTARRDLIAASVWKHGGTQASADLLAKIDSLRPPGLSEAQMEAYHHQLRGEIGL